MNSEKTTSKPNWMYIVLGVLALALIGLSIRLISLKGDNRKLAEERELTRISLQAEVDSLLKEHNALKVSYGTLSEELVEKDSVIQADAQEIKDLLAKQWDYNRIKKKVSELQVISQRYVRQLDSLYVVNRELVAENERIREKYQAEKKENTVLSQQKQELTNKVNMASILKAYNLNVGAVRFKGGSQEVPTEKAGRAERIRVDFTLAQNNLVKAGNKIFYIRIADPSTSILAKGTGDEYAFESNGEMLQFTEKAHVNYANEEIEVRAYYIKPSGIELMPGTYHVDIYDQAGNLCGQSGFDLR